jgi:hypothetical protein
MLIRHLLCSAHRFVHRGEKNNKLEGVCNSGGSKVIIMRCEKREKEASSSPFSSSGEAVAAGIAQFILFSMN